MNFAGGGPAWQALGELLDELADLDAVLGLLGWDEETCAPPLARGPRGRQTATLEALRHQRLCAPRLGELCDRLSATLPAGDPRAVLLARLARKRSRAMRVPEPLVRRLAEARSAALAAWEEARPRSDFAAFAPHLATIVMLTRERAQALGDGDPYDALLDEHEPGMTRARLDPLLDALAAALVPLLAAIRERPPVDRAFLAGARFPDAVQWQLFAGLLAEIGFDARRGRVDRSAHPFTIHLAEHDVRFTLRLDEKNPLSGLFAALHELGHALYDQGFDPAHAGTPLAEAPSTGLHEAQARLWENQVGRSRAFAALCLPRLAAAFPGALGGVSTEAFYRAVNAVAPGWSRVAADEVSYDLHVLLRHQLECALIGGDLAARELPAAWNEKLASYLGVTVRDDGEGCLQDVHWALGAFGYFPSYTLGNLQAAQLMAAFRAATPDADACIERGDFSSLLGWLRERVHRHGHLLDAEPLLFAATGRGLDVAPQVAHLQDKYRDLYQL